MAEEQDRHIAKLNVVVAGNSLEDDPELLAMAKVVRVTQDFDGPDQFELVMHTEQPHEAGTAPDPPFELAEMVGADLEVNMGLETPDGEAVTEGVIFKGLATGLAYELEPGEAMVFRLFGFCKLHLLTRARRTHTWESVKYSTAATELATKVNLSGSGVEATTTTYDHLSLNNANYFSFVSDLAHRVGYRVSSDDDKLIFAKPAPSSVATIKLDKQLKKARFRMDTSGLVSEVKVLGWDDKAKSQIVGVKAASDVSGGGTVGATLVADKYCESPWWMSAVAVTNQGDADELALSLITERANRFLKVEAEVEGDAAIKAGENVTFEGLTAAFDGDYFITKTVHFWTQETGYRTRIFGSRSWWSA